MFLALAILLASGISTWAQDERHVSSPDGQIHFRIFLIQPAPAEFVRIAYQVFFHGKPLLDTSYLGLDIHDQPLLGENVGLVGSKISETRSYSSLLAEYMQNGSLGRRVNIEVRVYNDGIAFRYVLPQSGPLMDFLMENEVTEFCLAEDAGIYASDRKERVPLSHLGDDARLKLPVLVEQANVGWLSIGEVPAGKYPPMSLTHSEGKVLLTRLPQHWEPPSVAYHGTTPMTTPWRVVLIGDSREAVMGSKIPSDLPK